MKYRITIAIILIIAFLSAGFLIYANNVLLPIKLKAKIIQELEKTLNKNVQIEKIRYNLFKGLLIQNLDIFDKTKEKSYLAVKEISFNFLIFPLLQKKIIIPLMRIESPQVNLALRQDNTLNITDFLKKWSATKEKPKFSVFILKIDVSKGYCQFRDERITPNYTKEISDLEIGIGLKLPLQIRFILQGKILNPQANASLISASGEYNLLRQDLKSKIKLDNIITTDYLFYLKALPFLVFSGIIDANLEINLKDKQLFAKGTIYSKDLKLKKEQLMLRGNINIEPQIKYNLESKEFKYKANLGFSNAVFSGLGYLKDISNIQGNIYLEDNKIWSDELKAQIFDTPIDIKGGIIFSPNQITWNNLLVAYKQIQYNTSGKLLDFKQPNIDFNLSSKGLSLKTNLDIKDKVIKIRKCLGKYLDSNFAIMGSLDTANNLLDLKGELNLFLKNAFGLLPNNISDNLKKIKLDGNCKIKGNVSGNIKDIKDLNARLKLSSPSLSIYDFRLDSLYLSLQQNAGLLNINDFSAKSYGGEVNLQLTVDFLKELPAYTSKIALSNIDLAKLKMDTKLKDKDIQGLLNLKADIQLTAQGPETMKGNGSIWIKDGKLWELNLFKGLGEFLFIPIYQKIIFRDAQINFNIQDKTISIVDSLLGGEELDLSGEGKIGLDGALDLTLHTEINADLIKESPDLRKFTSLIIGNLLTIKVSGTLQKPEYKVVPAAKEIIKQIKQFLFLE